MCFSGHGKPIGKESQAVNIGRLDEALVMQVLLLCLHLPTRDVHQATHRRKEPVSPLQDSFSKCERCFVAGSTFKRNKPGKAKSCQGDANPVLTLWAVKSHSFAFFFPPTPSSMWDLSSPTRDRICAPCSGSRES